MELGAEQHKCDPLTFGRYLKTARTAAVTIGNVPPGREGEPLRKYAEDLLRKWGRFRLVTDPDSADLVFQLRQFALRFRYNPLTKTQELRREPLPISEILVWPRGADPERDDVLWLDLYSGEWPRSDTVAGVMRLLRRDVEDAEKLVSK